jgi:hypothetical protein
MWISRIEYDNLRKERDEAVGRAFAFERHLTTITSAFEWLRVLFNQTSHERAMILENYTGVKVPLPSIDRRVEPNIPALDPMNSMPDFRDVGDDMARKMGLSWNEVGELTYNSPKNDD